MSYSLDANILVYASNEDSAHHEKANDFLAQCATDPEPMCLAWPTIFAYLRLTTHLGIFPRPLSPARAESNIAGMLRRSNVRTIGEREGFWTSYRAITNDHVARGKLVPDIHLAAILKQHDIRVFYTADRDFLRFDFLDIRDPLTR